MTDQILTLKQYVDRHQRAKASEYDVTLVEARELWSVALLRSQWWNYVEQAFNQGADFSLRAARMLTDTEVRSLARTTRGLRDGLPNRYLARFVASRKSSNLGTKRSA